MTPLYLIAEIYPHPDKLTEAREAFDDLIAKTVQEPGCLLYDLVVEKDSDHWLMLEKWASQKAWEHHMETDHVKNINHITPSLTQKKTVLRFLHPITEKVTEGQGN
jgi:quinol monooxygenase YgiN